jgi:hypothetical protein
MTGIVNLLSGLLLDELDKELERRGHWFVRYADDSNIHVKSARAGQRVLASVTRFLERRLKLAVNAAKSAVDRPWWQTFLGFTFTGHRPNRRRMSDKALEAYKHEVRRLTSRTRGVALGRVVGQLRQYLRVVCILWFCRSAIAVQRAGLLASASAALLSVEAVRSASVPGIAPGGRRC